MKKRIVVVVNKKSCILQMLYDPDLRLSQKGLKKVNDYCKTVGGVNHHPFPSASWVSRQVRQACDREQDDNLIKKSFFIPPGIPDMPEQEVIFEFQDIVSACVEMLLDWSIASHENWIWRAARVGGVYSEMNTATWWEDVENRSQALRLGLCIMPIILYVDTCHPDFRQDADLAPIVVSCGNYIGDINRTNHGKRCIGYWPVYEVLVA